MLRGRNHTLFINEIILRGRKHTLFINEIMLRGRKHTLFMNEIVSRGRKHILFMNEIVLRGCNHKLADKGIKFHPTKNKVRETCHTFLPHFACWFICLPANDTLHGYASIRADIKLINSTRK